MPAVYIALASLHYSQRVPHPRDNTLKRLAVAHTRKGEVGRIGSSRKRAVGLWKTFAYQSINAGLIRNGKIF
eukprot:3832940-Pleurochrysis_carterae.AAC.1